MSSDKIILSDLNRSTADEIVGAVKALDASDSALKELSLELDSTVGEIPLAYEVLMAINTSSVHLKTDSKGVLSTAGSILAFAGKPSKRTATVDTIFLLNNAAVAADKSGKIKRGSNPNLDFLFMVLSQLSGKQSPIKKTLATKDSITSFEAKKLNLIDSSSEFKSKYELLKTKENKKKGEQS